MTARSPRLNADIRRRRKVYDPFSPKVSFVGKPKFMELQPVEYPLQAKQHCVLSIASLKELIVFLKIPRPFEATGERLLELSAVFQSVPFSSFTLSA
jgi:hypothetical protein